MRVVNSSSGLYRGAQAQGITDSQSAMASTNFRIGLAGTACVGTAFDGLDFHDGDLGPPTVELVILGLMTGQARQTECPKLFVYNIVNYWQFHSN